MNICYSLTLYWEIISINSKLLFYQRQVYKLCKLNVQAEFTMKTSCSEAQSTERETTEEIRHKGNDVQAEETR